MPSYHGDIALGKTIDVKFTTIDSAGAPITLADSPVVAAYPGNSTTQITAGITLTVDFDAVTGLHNVRVVATGGNGYAAATNYALVLTAGTVGGVSVAGYVVGSFSIENRSAEATLDTIAGYIDTEIATLLSRLGTPSDLGSGATVAANLADIESQTDDIGAGGAGLTAVPWNAAWDAEVQSECADALVAYDPPTEAEMNARTLTAASYATVANQSTIIGLIDTEIAAIITHLTDIKGATFVGATDSLEAIRDRGDAAWTTAAGFSTHTAADVWSVAMRTLTAGTNIVLAKGVGVTGFNDLDAAGVRSSVGLAAANLDAQLTAIDDFLDTEIAALPTAAQNATAVRTELATELARIDAATSTRLAAAGYTAPDNAGISAILDDTGTSGVVVAAASKGGYSLSAAGLDAVAVTAPTGPAANFREMVVQLFRRFFKKATKTATEIKTFADDGTTVVTTQAVSDDGTTQTQGAAS